MASFSLICSVALCITLFLREPTERRRRIDHGERCIEVPVWIARDEGVATAGLSGGIGSEGPGGRVRTTFYVDMPDLQVALDRATQLGGKLASAPMTIPGTSISLAQFTDPDGNLVGLVKGMS